MDVEQLIGSMIEGTLTGRRKRSRAATRFLRGSGGGRSFLNASTLLTVGGLVWGAIETMQQQQAGTSGTPAPVPSPGQARGAQPSYGLATPPPVPGAPAPAAPAAASDIPEGAARIVRLMIAAARADGTLTDDERASILEHARAAGAEALVAAEIAAPTPLTRILDGITDDNQREDLYVLAYGIVRADETVSGAERIFLVQLGALLGLDKHATERLERDAAAKIDRAASSSEVEEGRPAAAGNSER